MRRRNGRGPRNRKSSRLGLVHVPGQGSPAPTLPAAGPYRSPQRNHSGVFTLRQRGSGNSSLSARETRHLKTPVLPGGPLLGGGSAQSYVIEGRCVVACWACSWFGSLSNSSFGLAVASIIDLLFFVIISLSKTIINNIQQQLLMWLFWERKTTI